MGLVVKTGAEIIIGRNANDGGRGYSSRIWK
jgi:hypothetical protein